MVCHWQIIIFSTLNKDKSILDLLLALLEVFVCVAVGLGSLACNLIRPTATRVLDKIPPVINIPVRWPTVNSPPAKILSV